MRLFAIILLFASLLLAEGKKKVLFIKSYHDGYEWQTQISKGVEQVLSEIAEINSFEMDTKRLPETMWQNSADRAYAQYETLKPDLVLLSDDNALRYLGKRFEKIDTPVVFMGINDNPKKYVALGKNITGVLERPMIIRSLKAIKEIVPDAKKALILFDDGETSSIITKDTDQSSLNMLEVKAEIKQISQKVEWENSIKRSSGSYDAIIVGLYQTIKDENNKVVDDKELLKWSVKNTTVPVFAFWDFSVGENMAIGGLVLYAKEQGIAAGEMAKEVLNGKDIKSIKPSTAAQGKFLFNKIELSKHKITIPPHIQIGAEYN